MEDFDYNTLRNVLCDQLDGFGIAWTDDQVQLLLRHLEIVIEKNKTVNLTRIVDPVEAVTLHLVDSLLPCCLGLFETGVTRSFVDVGTGAGFPGIPLGILTGYRGLLIDSVGKKVSAVSDFIKDLGLDDQLQACKMRAEELTSDMKHRYNFVIMRAVAKTNILMEYSEPFLAPGGCLVVEKANPDDLELQEASQAADICGMSLKMRHGFDLPNDLGHREIIVYEKVGKAKIKLPRPNGLAKQKPLGSMH